MWAPKILQDIMLKERLESIHFCLLDIHRESAELVGRLCERMNAEQGGAFGQRVNKAA